MDQELHYKLIFSQEPLLIRDVLGCLPAWCKYPLHVAQLARQYDFAQGGSLLRQKLMVDIFYVELIQLRSEEPFRFQYRVNQRRLFLFFLLEGRIDFSTGEDAPITQAREDTFYISYNQSGLYNATCQTGNNLALVVSIDTDWSLRATQAYPNLHEAVRNYLTSELPFGIMPHCPIDSKVRLWLQSIYSLVHEGSVILEGVLRIYIARALEYYEQILVATGVWMVYQVKQHIDKKFMDPDLDVAQLAESAFMHINTLQNKFKKEFHTTIYDYCVKVRLQNAFELIHTQGIPKKDVWIKVGYRDPSAFHKAYNKMYGKER